LDEFEILPGVPEACSKLKAAGFLLVVATNQPDVGRGTLKQETVETIHTEMRRQLPLDRVEVCYHPGQGQSECDCRKPKPGMLLRAARELGVDLAQSWMVGDRWRDVDCGRAAGCRTIFIDRGYAEELRQKPDFFAGNLVEAADIILRQSKKN
jgi:D-glycero-D-manno-heptose 1,7-bisphosphate phosphatase